MQYALLIYEDESIYEADKTGSAVDAIVAKHRAFGQNLGASMTGGAGLKATTSATVVRNSDGKQTIHDGPFAEAREQLGGFYLVEAPDLDAAIDMAKRIPMLKDGAVEIRPLLGSG